ncbi:murein transglycosylase A [Sphingomonas sp.]|uniref:murein transglycosylase A n=1 Tax=Sphingomonas sp. TaxID=28214 RepID=UPI001ECE379F|nr:murein transglycosylase A [Sphingomonas sp.]MBX3594404.1 murein transglycosylase A [Sphingomonas sp.]
MRAWGVAALAVLLSACASGVVPPGRPQPVGRAPIPGNVPVRQPVAATPIAPIPAPAAPATALTASAAGLLAGPPVDRLPITMAAAARGLDAFKLSCPVLTRRADASGLTRPQDWRAACDAASGVQEREATSFFARYFEAVQVADGKAFATGYFEPEIAGSRTRRPGYDVPIYGRPGDLIDVDLGAFSDGLAGKSIRGRVEGAKFVPYYDRTAIEQGALAGRGLEIAWAADPVELFFLQIQGSGRLRLPDGSVMRIGYASQNGRDYTGIGKLMLDRGLLQRGQASMQGIMAWLRANPEQGRAIMRENKSYVFFRELTGAGPLGALGVPVTGQGSVAADPKFVPMGAPVFLSMDRQDATGLWVAQDTGGAIKGTNRFDTFWGAGADARAIAGGMAARGTAWLLLPRGTLARLGVAGN